MMRRWLVFAVVALLTAPAAARADVRIGLSDQHSSALVDTRVAWLGISTARVVAPWDAALHPSPELDAWLQTARTLGLDALVSFAHRRGDDCRSGSCRLPGAGELRDAFRAFRARWPWVEAFGAWNEGNHASQPTAADPEGAARLYETLAATCPDCRILAAELLDTPGMLTWLRRFQATLHSTPALWGLHNYGDVTRARTATTTEALLAQVEGRLWITETGGIVLHVDGDGRLRWPYDEERARASVVRSLELADRHAGRIERLYVYQWQAAAHEPWDSGLIRPDGSARPSFDALAAWLRPAAGPPPDPFRPAAPRPGATAAARVLRRPFLTARGAIRVRVYCPAAAPLPCRLRLRVQTKPAHGRGRRTVGTDVTVLPRRAATTLSVRLPARRRQLIRRGRTTELLAEVRAPTWRKRFVVDCRR